MSTPHAPDLALELAITKLQAEMEKQFATVNGKLDLLTSEGARNAADIAALEARMSAVEKRVWIASGAAMLVGIVVPWIIQLMNN
jgi:hypothetical protein